MAFSFNTGVKSLALKYKQLLGAQISNRTLERVLQSNPYYPALYSLSDTFSKFKIDNQAYRIDPENFSDLDIDTPFVAYAKIRDIADDFILITKKTEDSINYIYKSEPEKTISIKSFLSFDTNELMFRGVIWKAELTTNSGEPGYKHKRQLEVNDKRIHNFIFTVSALVALSIILLSIPENGALSFLLIALLKIIGLFSVSFLLVYEIDKNNGFVKNICSLSKKTNCKAVLDSSASKIFGISLGEIGLYYFASTFLGLLLPNMAFEVKRNWILITNLLVVPFVFFSIYYQWRIVKQWCILCLLVQAVFILEFIWGASFAWRDSFSNMISVSSLMKVVIVTIAPVLAWQIIKPILIKNNDHDNYLYAYQRLQYNPDIFKHLLQTQQLAPPGWEKLGINIGDENAPNTVIKICNPYCGPCDIAHMKLEELLDHNKFVKLKIIYITSNSELDTGRDIVKHILKIASTSNKQLLKECLDDWYTGADKDYNRIRDKYPLNDMNFDAEIVKIDEMSSWCRAARVTHTPTIYVNGHLLPENYNISELQHVLT